MPWIVVLQAIVGAGSAREGVWMGGAHFGWGGECAGLFAGRARSHRGWRAPAFALHLQDVIGAAAGFLDDGPTGGTTTAFTDGDA